MERSILEEPRLLEEMTVTRRAGVEPLEGHSLSWDKKLNPSVKGNGDTLKAELDEKPMSNFSLSAREKEIMELVAEGKGTREITDALLISADDVEYHLRSVIGKLNGNGKDKLRTSIQPTQPAKSSQPKIVASIPCYNEERYINNIVCKVRQYVDQVIVVDDGSYDNTSQVATAAGALVLSHKNNKGAGAATRSCFETAKVSGADILITIDGDNQHSPEEIPELIAPILKGEAELVIGSRFIKSDQHDLPNQRTNVPRYRKFGIDVLTRLFNIVSRTNVSDAQCCYRAYSRKILDSINITEDGFGFSIEVLMQANAKGFLIKEVPISCLYHSDGSTVNPVLHGIGVALTTLKLYLNGVKSKFTNHNNVN